MISVFSSKEPIVNTRSAGSYNIFLKLFCYILIAYCVFIRCYLYVYHKDLWLDESAIADAIYEASWSDLLAGRLPRMQSCPLAFAIINKLLSYITSYSPYVLYFLPTVAGISIAFLIYHFGMKLYGVRFAASGLTIYSLLFMPLYYSSEFKPYIFDFLFTIVLFGNLFVDIRKNDACRVFLSRKYPLLFAVSWLCSSTAIVCAAAIGITIFVYLCLSRRFTFILLILKLAKLYCPFVIFAGLYYFLFLRQGASGGMYKFWKIGFIPSNPSEIPQWCNTVLKSVFYGLTTTIYGSVLSNIMLCLAILGLVTAFMTKNKKYELIAFAVLSVIVCVLAIKVYPIGLPVGMHGARLVFYILPVIIFFAALGICSIVNISCKLQRRYQFFIVVFTVTIALFGVIQSGAVHFKNRIHVEDSFQMYQTVLEKYNPNSDLIVAYNMVEHSFTYWKIFNSQQNNLPFVSIPRDKLITLKEDLFDLIGKKNFENKKRIFFLFTHRDPRATNNVKNYLIKHNIPLQEFKWYGAELLIVNLENLAMDSRI